MGGLQGAKLPCAHACAHAAAMPCSCNPDAEASRLFTLPTGANHFHGLLTSCSLLAISGDACAHGALRAGVFATESMGTPGTEALADLCLSPQMLTTSAACCCLLATVCRLASSLLTSSSLLASNSMHVQRLHAALPVLRIVVFVAGC